MQLIELLKKRYSTKSFDSTRAIPDRDWKQIEETLRLCPSSINAQPWHFVVTSSQAGKKRFLKGTEEKYGFNSQKILDASHVVLFCSKLDLEDAFLLHLLEKEKQDGRFANEELVQRMHGARNLFVGLHKNHMKDLEHWLEKQVYLNVGTALLGAAVLGLDALPMEGIDIDVLNKEFDLTAKGLKSVALVCFGYRSKDDFNASLPKSRLEAKEIFTYIK